MENQGKSNRQLQGSYIGAFVGLVGILLTMIYLALS
jgi:hypothetical protein